MILGIYTEAVLGQTLTEGTSNPCNRGLDIDCYSQYSTLKKSTVHLYSCAGLSGVILNSTVPNNKLYLLTASHGISSRFLEQREGTKVYWGWERTCLAPHQSGYSALSTSSYVKLKVLDRSLDFALFEITVPPLNYTPYYAGWDCSGKTTHITHPIVIHHPQKDVKKIAFPEFTNVTRAPSSWEYICLLQQPFVSNFTANSMWEYRFTQGNGLVEPGTSGSPIFDDLNKVIGISSFHDPNSQDCIDSKMLGAKFQLIYPHIKSYLDPQQSGVLKIDGYDPSNPHADTYEGNNTIAEASTESIFPDLAIADFKGFLQSKISSLTDVDYYSLTLKIEVGSS
jgi:lysyl endopeptidase